MTHKLVDLHRYKREAYGSTCSSEAQTEVMNACQRYKELDGWKNCYNVKIQFLNIIFLINTQVVSLNIVILVFKYY
jgi:hypothetical protein